MGNTCYLNSTLQILINLPIMKEMFIDNSDTINTFFNNHNPNTHNCALADEFWEVLVERWQSKPPEADFIYNPSKFGEVVHDIDPYFEPFRQHDANELLLSVLNELNEEMNINKIKSNEKNMNFDDDLREMRDGSLIWTKVNDNQEINFIGLPRPRISVTQ